MSQINPINSIQKIEAPTYLDESSLSSNENSIFEVLDDITANGGFLGSTTLQLNSILEYSRKGEFYKINLPEFTANIKEAEAMQNVMGTVARGVVGLIRKLIFTA